MSFKSYEVRHKEIEVLQTIYKENLKDLRKTGLCNKLGPLDLSLTLSSPRVGNCKSQIDLHVICDETYPDSIPLLFLENGRGLSNNSLDELKDRLDQKAAQCKGEEMIFKLAQFVEDFLQELNISNSKKIYDEMLDSGQNKKMKDLQAKEIELDKQLQRMTMEVQKRDEPLIPEDKKWKEIRHTLENETDIDDRKSSIKSRSHFNSSSYTSEYALCQCSSAVIQFEMRNIQRGKCLKHSDNHKSYCGIDKDSGKFILITEWIFHYKNEKELQHIQEQLRDIDLEINYLVKLKPVNIAQYYGIKYDINEDNIIVNLFREFVFGISCSFFASQNIKINNDYIKFIAKGILSGLDYLHKNNVIHKDLKASCVYINKFGLVQLSKYSIDRRLLDLSTYQPNDYSKETDVFKFGLILLSLLQGYGVSEENVQIPNGYSSDLQDFLTKCLSQDENIRSTTSELLNHSFINEPLPKLSLKQVVEEIELNCNQSPEITQNLMSQSRIHNDFEILHHLGKGGHGDVLKVKHKLDSRLYAIKCIRLNPKSGALNKKLVREVKLLSRLNHENVVRYFSSWIESTQIKGDIESTSSSVSTEDRILKIMKKFQCGNIEIPYDSKFHDNYSADNESNDNSIDEYNDEDEGYVERNRDSKSQSIQFENDTGYSLSSFKPSNPIEVSDENIRQSHMYIQMELCEKNTLRTAIDGNLYLDQHRLMRLFREIVEGLVYIHQQGIIHRDLKPGNIFLDAEDHVKIGDFGLATKSKQNKYMLPQNITESETDESNSGCVGTPLYVAPEIIATTEVNYCAKVDIYSLGITFFEMCYGPFSTNMERNKILTKLRQEKRIFPSDFIDRANENQHDLIRWLLDHNISKRPTAQELLQYDHIPHSRTLASTGLP